MGLLVSGVLLWMVVHLFPVFASEKRKALVDRMGFNPYRGVFSLLIILSIIMMVFGWRQSVPGYVYATGETMRQLSLIGMVFAFILIGSSGRPTQLGRFVRHPQLTGVLLWCICHLLANGDSRSLVLFGGIGLWCIVAIIGTNRRDGIWIKSDGPGWGKEVAGWVVSLAIMAALVWAHPWLSGVPLY